MKKIKEQMAQSKENNVKVQKEENNMEATNNTEVKEKEQGGRTIMNNTFKKNREAATVARDKAAKQAEKERVLASIEEVGIVETMDDVTNGSAYCRRGESGEFKGVNGGKYIQEPVCINGVMTTIAGTSEEEIARIKAQMEEGIMGDQMLHKKVVIMGVLCDCCGRTVEELADDIMAAEIFAKKHGGAKMFGDLAVAEELVDAGYIKENLKEVVITASNGYAERCLISYPEKAILHTNGEELVNLSDLSSELTKEDVEKLLIERAGKALDAECEDIEGEYDDEFDYDAYDDEFEMMD